MASPEHLQCHLLHNERLSSAPCRAYGSPRQDHVQTSSHEHSRVDVQQRRGAASSPRLALLSASIRATLVFGQQAAVI